MRLFISGFWIFIAKKSKNVKCSFRAFSTTNGSNQSGKRAFESWQLTFLKNKKIFMLPQFPLISAVVEEGLRKCSFKIKKNHQIHASSNVLKTHSRWGRMILKCLFFNSSWFRLSSALSLKRFGQKFANLENFKNFEFFWKFQNSLN